MSDIKVFENFLEPDIFNNLKNIFTGAEFPWYLNNGINHSNDGLFQFTHTFYNQERINSDLINILEPIIVKLNLSKLVRIKANLLTISSKNIEHGFHTDFDYKNLTTAIFYINTNNGYTIFENNKKIMSVENKLVTFPSFLKHSGSSCTDENVRIVLNLNYFEKQHG